MLLFADVIIIGSGLAALMTADQLHPHKRVAIVTKSLASCNTRKAQGGIAVAFSPNDHWLLHLHDTIEAGANLNDWEAVQQLTTEGPQIVKNLIAEGLTFDQDPSGDFALGQEGAHSERRILHAGGDATGEALYQFMYERVKNHVTWYEGYTVTELLMSEGRCMGVIAESTEQEIHILSPSTVLATGGYGGLYSYSSNHPDIFGEGLALAYRAGADLIDLEFVQFHPTLLQANGRGVGLVSEAVRGEGAKLVTRDGKEIMKGVHPLADLAPRDIVAREIFYQNALGEDIELEITMIQQFSSKFPTVSQLCEKHNIDLRSGRIPIIPGAHFAMGGIKTNLHGETTVPGLYAVGEAACNRVHGANRLASNSLLETVVFGNKLGQHLLKTNWPVVVGPFSRKSAKNGSRKLPTAGEIRNVMMKHVGIVRHEQSLLEAKRWLEQFDVFDFNAVDLESRKIVNMLLVSWLITTSALERTESRGGHYRLDYPNPNRAWDSASVHRNIVDRFLGVTLC